VRWQIETLEGGGAIQQATVLFDPDSGETRAMRTKEDAHDYRYFPDPDLLPLTISESWITEIGREMPEPSWVKFRRFVDQLAIPASTAAVLTSDPDTSEYFEQAVRDASPDVVRQVANQVAVGTNAKLNEMGMSIAASPVTPQQQRRLAERVVDGTLSSKMAKEVFDAAWAGEGDVDAIIEKRGLKQISDSGELDAICDQVIAANAQQVADYRSGKDKAFNSLVGQVMKLTRGKANPQQVNEILKRKLAT
jgi:aspartyl-tRNA(Asn)/glutamyl-tRNA(Gln) amidotransferase subunit B